MRAELHFRDETPDRELVGVREAKFENGKCRWVYVDPKQPGLAKVEYEIERIAYIRFGAN